MEATTENRTLPAVHKWKNRSFECERHCL